MWVHTSKCADDSTPFPQLLNHDLLQQIRGQVQQQPTQKQHKTSHAHDSEAAKLSSRLALTGRYQPCKLAAHIEEHMARVSESRTEMCVTRDLQATQDFRLEPPHPELLKVTMLLFDKVRDNRDAILKLHKSDPAMLADAAPSDSTFASLVMDFLDEQIKTWSICSEDMPLSRKEQTHMTSLQGKVESFCLQLIQPSHRSLLERQAALAARESHMQAAVQAQGLQKGHTCKASPLDAFEADTAALVASGDFQLMQLGTKAIKDKGHSNLGDAPEDNPTAMLLHARLMLRSGPFMVVCAGADHIGAFLKLAGFTELYLQLLPTASHKCRVRE